MSDPHFQSHRVLAEVSVDVPTSPVGPIHVYGWGGSAKRIPAAGSAVVLPLEPTAISYYGMDAMVSGGAYALVPGGTVLRGGTGLIIYTPDYVGLPGVGGPIESAGRLKYIDGCSDSLVIAPDLYGHPCLNHLHIPAGINQTAHIHTSDRIGIILRGSGECVTPYARYPLVGGMFWRIPCNGVHSFHTSGEALDVLAWHPDSETGPKHDDHPMLSRTIVDGVSAKEDQHRAIRTTEIRA